MPVFINSKRIVRLIPQFCLKAAVSFGIVTTLSLVFVSVAVGQLTSIGNDVARPVPGRGHDYIAMLAETVSPANGSVNIKIPLPIPKARGFSLPVSLTYNSGSVHRFASGAAGGGQMIQDASSITSSGWGDSLPYASATFVSLSLNNPVSDVYCQFSSSYVFYGPAGDSHMLGLAGVSYLEGQTSQGGTSPSICSTYGSPITEGGDGTLLAVAGATCNGFPPNDGTPEPPSCQYGGFPFVVTDEHKNVYNFPWPEASTGPLNAFFFPSTIEDRNGNITTFSVTPDPNNVFPASEQVTDSLGRVLVSASHTPNTSFSRNGQTSYVVGGLTYSVAYETVNANFSLASQQLTPPGGSYVCATSFSVPSAAEGPGDVLPADNGVENVVQSITLPNGQQYTFEYNDPYGLISQINYPGGGWVKYTWKLSDTYSDLATFDAEQPASAGHPESVLSDACGYYYKSPVLATREVGYTANSSAAQTQTFTYNTQWSEAGGSWTSKTTTVQTTDNVTGKTAQTIYTYSSIAVPPPPSPTPPIGGQAPAIASQTPVESSIQYYDWGNATTPLETVNKVWGDIFTMTGEQDILPGALNGESKETISCYLDQDLLIEKDEYGWNQAAPALTSGCGQLNPFRKTVINYLEGQPCQVIVYNSSGTVVSEEDGYTDGTSFICGNVGSPTTPLAGTPTAAVSGLPPGTHDETNFGPSSTNPRGNITKLVKYLNTGASTIETYTFDETGQVLSSTDACGNATCSDMTGTNHTTTYSYTDAPSGGNAAGNSNAYLTQITDPLGHTAKFTYNYPTGELASSTDVNGQVTGFTYNDPFDRLTQTNYPDGGQTTISYNDSVPSVTTTQLISNTGTPGPKVSEVIMDGMGHTIQTLLNSDPYGADIVATTYDGMGNAYTVTNPYRSTVNGSSTFYYDAMRRKVEEVEPDGSVLQWCYNGIPSSISTYCSSHLGSVATGTWVDYTDEVGNHWQRTTDAFGRLTEVMEPNGSAQTASMETDYGFDVLNNLTSVTQWGGASGSSGARTRSFVYDSLSRLASSQNPESGLTSYSYDANGNLQSKTSPLVNAASGTQTISYCYDPLDRLTYKFYSSSPSCTSPNGYAASYSYDSSSISGATNDIGRLTDEKSYINGTLVAEDTPYQYDPLGRLRGENQNPYSPLNTSYSFGYGYDLAGDSLTANNGLASSANAISFNYAYDAAAQLTQATVTQPSGWNPASYPTTLLQANSATETFFGGATPPYDPMGHLVLAQLGLTSALTNGAITTQRTYDVRERLTSEVDEGYPIASTATASTGSISISGTENSSGSGSPTHATGTVTITGAEGSQLVCTTEPTPEPVPIGDSPELVNSPESAPAKCTTIFDTGSLSVSIDGFVATASYGSLSTDATIATALASALSASGSPVTATASNNVLTMTSIATGTSADYPFSVSNGADFSGTDSGAALTGGSNGLVADTGTITAQVNGVPATISWGSGSTAAGLASSLASAINSAASSIVTATANQASVALVSKATGTTVNYSVTATATDTASESPSFAVTAASLTGGTNQSTSYSPIYIYNVPTGGYAANSNLVAAGDSITGQWAFRYDTLDRLIASSTTSGYYAGESGCWAYDAFGNRQMEEFSTSTSTPCASVTGITYNTNNQVGGAAPTLTYDGAGNVLSDTTTGNHYLYDTEGRLCAMGVNFGGVTSYTQYVYDAEGRRVAKGSQTSLQCPVPTSANGFTLTNQYLLGQGGEQVTELNGASTWLHTNAWVGGKLLATYDSTRVHFVLTDPLGTKRVQAAASGTPELNCTSLPFGNDVAFSRTTNCYTPPNGVAYEDTAEEHFTGKERDAESGLDYFGARYYASTAGRFISPDWSAKEEPVPYAKMDDPQTLNLYIYVGNNPLVRDDPDGHAFGLDDLVGALAGGAIGVGSEVLKDLATGQKITPGAIAGAAVGGAIVGEGIVNIPETLGGSAVAAAALKGAAQGAVSNLVQQGVDNATGNQKGFNGKSLAVSTALGAVTGGLASKVPNLNVPGVSSGSGNMKAVAQGVATKIENGIVSSMSLKTAVKGAIGGQVADAGRTVTGTAATAAAISVCNANPDNTGGVCK